MKTIKVNRTEDKTNIEINEKYEITRTHEIVIFIKFIFMKALAFSCVFSILYFFYLLTKFQSFLYAGNETLYFFFAILALFIFIFSFSDRIKVLENYFHS